jgi:hypothetical protein
MTLIDEPEVTDQSRWIRPPVPNKRCQYTGLSRRAFYNLLRDAKGEIKTVLLKRAPDKKRGSRLVDLRSLLAYIARCESRSRVQVNAGGPDQGGRS